MSRSNQPATTHRGQNYKQGSHGNKRFFWNPVTDQVTANRVSKEQIYFQSIFELKVYKKLLRYIQKDRIDHQHPLLIKPHTRHFPERVWKVDFWIKPKLDECFRFTEPIYIEAKGHQTEAFHRSLENLEYFNPEAYQNLIFVSENKIDTERPVYNLAEFEHYLRSLN